MTTITFDDRALAALADRANKPLGAGHSTATVADAIREQGGTP